MYARRAFDPPDDENVVIVRVGSLELQVVATHDHRAVLHKRIDHVNLSWMIASPVDSTSFSKLPTTLLARATGRNADSLGRTRTVVFVALVGIVVALVARFALTGSQQINMYWLAYRSFKLVGLIMQEASNTLMKEFVLWKDLALACNNKITPDAPYCQIIDNDEMRAHSFLKGRVFYMSTNLSDSPKINRSRISDFQMVDLTQGKDLKNGRQKRSFSARCFSES